jgi:pantoate--beta-alanine ligase
MNIIKTIKEIHTYTRTAHASGKTVAFVPTMGYLHEGHLALVDTARKNADIVIVSIFVNPTQFAPNEDLDAYPRDFERDCKLCETRKVDAVFAPEPQEMYPTANTTWVNEESLTDCLCGQSRPTHFRGVTTVVTKLFNAVNPDIAVFGEKDYQQAAVIKKMTSDLNFQIKILTVPIVRESDGLAMSSRNRYLSETERKNALSINKSIKEAENMILSGEKNITSVHKTIQRKITQNQGRVDYIEILDPDTLKPLKTIQQNTLIAVAAFFGKTRLIDNKLISCS